MAGLRPGGLGRPLGGAAPMWQAFTRTRRLVGLRDMVRQGESGDGPPIVVLGGANLIAGSLLPRLAGRSSSVTVVARRPVGVPDGFSMRSLDVLDPGPWRAPPGSTVLSILPLAVLVAALPALIGMAHVIAVGSTSVFGKADAADPRDRAAARSLAESEAALRAWCAAHATRFTILRPTLVYDGRGDRNIARMARLIRRFRVLPIAAPGTGLRQPIHAADVAGAMVGAIGNPAALDRAFDIAGAEVLTYRAMAERVFAAQGLRPRIVPLPAWVLRLGFRLAARTGLMAEAGTGASAFSRMNQDLVFDTAEGLRVLGYAPRPFAPAPP